MSESLDKAKGAMTHARELDQANARNMDTGLFQSRRIEAEFNEAIAIARTHAAIAQAEALEALANLLESVIERDSIRHYVRTRVG